MFGAKLPPHVVYLEKTNLGPGFDPYAGSPWLVPAIIARVVSFSPSNLVSRHEQIKDNRPVRFSLLPFG